jgi:hypothetical protein
MMCPILLPYVYRNVPIVQNVELSLASASSMITTVCVSLLVVIATVLWTRRRDGYEATMTGRLARATAIVLTIVTISVASDVPKLSLVMLRYEWLDGTAAWWYSAREWIGKICMLLLGTAGALSIRRAVMTIPNPEVARFASTTIAIGWLSLLVKIGAHLWITYSRRTAGMNARTPFLSTVDEIIPKVATVWLVAAYAAFLVLIVIAVRVMKAVPWLVYVERSTRTASGAAAPTSPP